MMMLRITIASFLFYCFSSMAAPCQNDPLPSSISQVSVRPPSEYNIDHPSTEKIVSFDIAISCGSIVKTHSLIVGWSVKAVRNGESIVELSASANDFNDLWFYDSGIWHFLSVTGANQACFDISVVIVTQREQGCYNYYFLRRNDLFFEQAP